ncbi:hypothetical protein CDIK_2276 [Cucumispora dikerogammari]|nr:hypothetical protein CDIK_2276 [Cucumispora dikerogammari]
MVCGKSYPLCLFLLKTKKEKAYATAFDFILKATQINPLWIITDFEAGLINALKITFPLSKIRGCTFHFGQAVWKRGVQEGLFRHEDNVECRRLVKKVLNLTFYPLADIRAAYSEIKKEAQKLKDYSGIEKFFEYYQNTYLSDEITSDIASRYEPTFWSAHERILHDIPRSTNSVEGWHRSLNNSSFVKHPNIARFIEIIRIECEELRIALKQAQTGKYIFIGNQNFIKENKLKAVVRSYKIYTLSNFNVAINQVYTWSID